jgi:hypothetical protein
MIILTPRYALEIQRKQIEYYEKQFPQMREAATKATNVDGLDLDKPYPVRDLRNRIPRGVDLGNLIGVNL